LSHSGSADNPAMRVIQTLVERLIALIFGLVGTVATIQCLALVAALGSAIAVPRDAGTPDWAVLPLILGAGLCLTLFVGGIVLKIVVARSGLGSTWGEDDESLRLQWLAPASIPMLVLPSIAFFQSGRLIQLWSEVFAIVERFGGPQRIKESDGLGLLLLPAAAVLLVPFLEAIAAFFLIAVPPLLLLLMATRSRRFRLESTRLAIVQCSLIAASVLGAELFGTLVDLAAPHILAAGEREGVMVLQELTRGWSVLTGTAIVYSGLALANVLALWILLAGTRTKEPAVEMAAYGSSQRM